MPAEDGSAAPLEPVSVPVEDAIDLHTFRAADVRGVVADYVETAAAAGFSLVRVIHGRGRGVQRGIVQAALERHHLVEAFWDAPESHLGATVVRLRTRPTPDGGRDRR